MTPDPTDADLPDEGETVAKLRQRYDEIEEIMKRDGAIDPAKELAVLRDAIDALEAARARQGAPDDWRLMGAEPKDGTTFLAAIGPWITVGFWHRVSHRLHVDAPGYPPYREDEQPTHWMPLPPAAPEASDDR